ncbi:O-antigen ligase family protein [Candidatus Daviesbacteria bacterium]|nr:O-antigen ligase family protein [Candidatus Daviesbacteria bacterium]
MKHIASKINLLLFWPILFLFAFIPLYPKFPLFNVSGTFVAIRVEDLLIALVTAIWSINLLISGKIKDFFSTRINQVLILFLSIGFLSLFSAVFLTHTVSPNLGLFHYLRRLEFIMLLPIVASVVKTKKQLSLSLIVLSLVLVSTNIFAFGQQYLDWPVISTTNSEFAKGLILRLTPEARVNATFAGHYDFAAFLTMAFCLMVPLFFAVRKKFKLWIVILGVMSSITLVMTSARVSFVAAIFGIILSLLLTGKKKFLLLLAIVLTLILIYPSNLRDRFISTVNVNILQKWQSYQGKTEDQKIRSRLNIPTLAVKTSSTSAQTSTFATGSGLPSDITPGEPVDTTELGVYRSFSIRLNIEWPRAIAAFQKNPLLGTGYSSLGIATDNDVLRSLGEVGLMGTLAFILLLIAIAKRIWFLFKNSERYIKFFSAGVLSIILAFLLNSLFIDVFEASKVASLFWMILGLNLAAFNFKES